MRDDLEALSDAELIDAAVEYVVRKVGGDAENRLELLSSLPEGLRAFFAVWTVDAEVKNGGFSQYFWNRGNSGASVAVFGFQLLGAEDHAALMEEAIKTWERERPIMSSFEARGTPEAFSEWAQHTALRPLDMQYYGLSDIEPALARFLRAHPELFDDESGAVSKVTNG
ncbi:MAG TPA: DUF4375 domain-containing protein [Methylomirabilota bacterium]|nr:DUF4375 domain-containing protein [Methylomirabilota bacterium]